MNTYLPFSFNKLLSIKRQIMPTKVTVIKFAPCARIAIALAILRSISGIVKINPARIPA